MLPEEFLGYLCEVIEIKSKISVKVHSFLKQSLNNIQLIQFGGTFTKPFKLTSADISWKYHQIESTDGIVENNALKIHLL